MERRLFGAERLEHLRDELDSDRYHAHNEELKRLGAELSDVDQALHRQTLRMEEDDDPDHPVVALAKERIAELSLRREKLQSATRAIERERDVMPPAEKIEAMLGAIPDLRGTWSSPTDDTFAETLEAFDLTVAYDKLNRTLALGATVRPEPTTTLNAHRPPTGGRGNIEVAGAGFEPATFGL
jgi:hypothetical protein